MKHPPFFYSAFVVVAGGGLEGAGVVGAVGVVEDDVSLPPDDFFE